MNASAKPCVVIAAGGTGGHMFPAAAFAQDMFQRGWRVILLSDARGRRYAENFPAERVEDVPAASLTANPIKALPALFKIMRGIAASKKHFAEWKPLIVAGFGGYPSFPALVAAKDMKVPFIIHEQNSVLGRVNRAMAKDAAIVACGFERLDRLPPQVLSRKRVVGNPVRAPILAVREQPYPAIPAGGRINVLVIGGSQGARLFGEVIPDAFALLPQDLRARIHLTQQVREEQLAAVKKHYASIGVAADIAPFFSNMADLYKVAHLVIARAGASSVTELQAAGRPAILVPFAAAADDHQTANAEGLSSVGAADVFSESEFDAETLAHCLEQRLSDPHGLSVRAAAARSTGRPEAAKTLADLAETSAKKPF